MLTEIPKVRRRNPFFDEIVYRAFRDIGFVFMEALGVVAQLPRVFAEFRRVFALPEEVKQKYNGEDVFYQRGWTPPFTEIGIACRHLGPEGSPVPNAYEAWFMGPDLPPDHPMFIRSPKLNSPNIWPEEVPEFRTAMWDLYRLLLPVGMEVLAALAPRIGKTPDYFDEITSDGPTVMRALHYPAVKPKDVGKVIWACQHTDINLATVLPASTRPGLWVRRRDGEWIPGMAPPGYVIVQVGDMLEHLTGGELTSAAHEVRAPDYPTTEGRYSAALFMHARSDVMLGFDEDEDPNKHKIYPKRTADDLLQTRLDAIGLGKDKKKRTAY